MYANKCYFHPHAEGQHSCRGCRLPVCMGCAVEAGFCPECVAKKRQMRDMHAMRAASAQTAVLQGASAPLGASRAGTAPGTGAVPRAPRSASGRLLPSAATAAALERRGPDRRVQSVGAPNGQERRSPAAADRRGAPDRRTPSVARTAAATRRLHTEDQFRAPAHNPRGTAYRPAGARAQAPAKADGASAAVPFALGIGATLLALVAVLMVSSAWRAHHEAFESPFQPHGRAGAHQQF